MMLAQTSIDELVHALAAKTSTPGGGAAAAISAALGCASGAMAARYTTGPKFPEHSATAENLATVLDAAAADCLRLAQADAEAYAAVRAAKASKDTAATTTAEQQAARIPADLIAATALHAAALAAFRQHCNRWLVSDIDVGIRLLAGAGRAGFATLLVNQPTDVDRAVAEAHLAALSQAEAVIP